MNLLKTSFEYAVEPLQYLKKNPMLSVKKPKMDKKRTRERYILNQDEWKRIITRFDADSKFHIPLMIGYHTGLRIGETLGLTWNDIDFENGTLTVNKQLLAYKSKDDPRKWTLAPPKTDASNRTIPIGKTLLNALKKEQLKQKQHRLMYGEYYKKYTGVEILPNLHEITLDHEGNNDLNFICVHEDGKFMHWDGMRYCFRVIQEKLEIRFEYHALRHTHATMLFESGANIKSVQKRLGHEKIETTLQTYAHDTDLMNNDAVDIFEKAICPQ
jgi:integrase